MVNKEDGYIMFGARTSRQHQSGSLQSL